MNDYVYDSSYPRLENYDIDPYTTYPVSACESSHLSLLIEFLLAQMSQAEAAFRTPMIGQDLIYSPANFTLAGMNAPYDTLASYPYCELCRFASSFVS